MKDLEIPKECFPAAHAIQFKGDESLVDSLDEIIDYILYPNCITPNGDSLNDEFYVILNSDSHNLKTENFKFYNKRRKLVAERNDSNWDGKLSDGTVENGSYAFTMDIILEDGSKVQGSGAFCVRKCFMPDDNKDAAVFGDQLHPRLGNIYPSDEKMELCE